MLVYWIPETANTIPANATHRVGIGAIVLNDKREVLAALIILLWLRMFCINFSSYAQVS